MRSNVQVASIEIFFGVDSVEIFCWFLILKHECLQVLQAPSKVPSTCLSFCSYKPLQSPKAKRLLFDFAAFFSYVLYKIKISRFSSDRSLYKIKVSPFHKWAPYICSTKSGSKISSKNPSEILQYIKTFEGFLMISRPLKILRAKISGMPGASSKFQKPRTLERIK